MIFAMQKVDDGAVKQEAPSSSSIKQEAPSPHALAAGIATGNKVILLKHTVMFAAHPLTSLAIAGSFKSIATVCFQKAFQTK